GGSAPRPGALDVGDAIEAVEQPLRQLREVLQEALRRRVQGVPEAAGKDEELETEALDLARSPDGPKVAQPRGRVLAQLPDPCQVVVAPGLEALHVVVVRVRQFQDGCGVHGDPVTVVQWGGEGEDGAVVHRSRPVVSDSAPFDGDDRNALQASHSRAGKSSPPSITAFTTLCARVVVTSSVAWSSVFGPTSALRTKYPLPCALISLVFDSRTWMISPLRVVRTWHSKKLPSSRNRGSWRRKSPNMTVF